MKTLKTKTPVIINTLSVDEAIVFMEIGPILYSYTHYSASIKYFYEKEVIQLDEEGQPQTVIRKVYLPKVPPVIFTTPQASMIEDMSGGVVGTHVSDKLNGLIVKAAFAHLQLNPTYGLDHTGWELVS